jgi:E1A-binding protein p400
MSIDELIAKYKRNAPANQQESEEEDDDDSLEEEEEVEDSDDENMSDSELEEESVEEMEIGSDNETEKSLENEIKEPDVSLKNLLDDQQSTSAENCDNGDALLNDVAAIAQSIQPKGNTLSSTSVVTPIPSLLRHTLREYQHIGLDWLVTMHDRKLNGILADEVMLYFIITFLIKCNSTFFLCFLSISDGSWQNDSNNFTPGSFGMRKRKLGTSFDYCAIVCDAQLGNGV